MVSITMEVTDMNSTIESLYYGNINPSERSVRRGSEYDRLLGVLTQSEDTLEVT